MTVVPTLRQKLDRLVWSDMLEERLGIWGRMLATILRYVFALTRDIVKGQLTLRSRSRRLSAWSLKLRQCAR